MNHDAPVIHVVFFSHFKAQNRLFSPAKPGCIIRFLRLCSNAVIISFKHSNQCDHIPKVAHLHRNWRICLWCGLHSFIRSLRPLCVIRRLILAYNIIAGQFPGSFFLLLSARSGCKATSSVLAESRQSSGSAPIEGSSTSFSSAISSSIADSSAGFLRECSPVPFLLQALPSSLHPAVRGDPQREPHPPLLSKAFSAEVC